MNSRYLANKSVVNLWFYIRDPEQTNVEGRFRGGGALKKCFFYYPEGLLLQIATAFLLQSAIGTTKCGRTPSSWVTTVVASGLPQFAPAPTPAEKGDWWDHS